MTSAVELRLRGEFLAEVGHALLVEFAVEAFALPRRVLRRLDLRRARLVRRLAGGVSRVVLRLFGLGLRANKQRLGLGLKVGQMAFGGGEFVFRLAPRVGGGRERGICGLPRLRQLAALVRLLPFGHGGVARRPALLVRRLSERHVAARDRADEIGVAERGLLRLGADGAGGGLVRGGGLFGGGLRGGLRQRHVLAPLARGGDAPFRRLHFSRHLRGGRFRVERGKAAFRLGHARAVPCGATAFPFEFEFRLLQVFRRVDLRRDLLQPRVRRRDGRGMALLNGGLVFADGLDAPVKRLSFFFGGLLRRLLRRSPEIFYGTERKADSCRAHFPKRPLDQIVNRLSKVGVCAAKHLAEFGGRRAQPFDVLVRFLEARRVSRGLQNYVNFFRHLPALCVYAIMTP